MDVDAKGAQSGSDAVVARIAARQHGVIRLDQLELAGIRRQGRIVRVKAGRLHRVHRGVYAVGHAGLSREGQRLAAVFACGPDAVLSHGSAAALWDLLPSPSLVHVTVPTRAGRRRRSGLRIHRTTTLLRSHVTRRHAIPVTNPSRTLADLRRTVPRKRFERARRQAEFLKLPIDPVLEPDGTRSDFEALFLAFCRRRRLPRPEVNVRIGAYLVDFAWPGRRLVVEVDGFESHGTRSAFEADRERDAELKLLGYDVVRITWRRLDRAPAEVAATLRALLRDRA